MTEHVQALAEIQDVLQEIAQRRSVIFYSELTPQVRSLYLEPNSDLLGELLDGISRDSNSKDKGMLSAVVIRKGEEPLPGPGFFKLARELGKAIGPSPDLEEKLVFHATELKLVHDAYADRRH